MTDENKKQAVTYAIGQLKKGRKDLEKIKREAALRFGTGIIKNADIIAAAPTLQLRKKPVRTLSGITTVALMVKPDGSCSHGCIYCPFTGKAAKSYTGEEPAALRARDANYDPAKQVKIRLKQYVATGHPTEKCEVVVMGGTFLEMPAAYKQRFIKAIYESMNGKKAATLATAKKANEKAKNRVIGLTIETRPDVCGKKQIDEMLGYGATRVELGVQHPDDRIYQLINRG
ncbi:MAG: radical SAM protein, partial [Candidatus Micrarchaeota archaeon]